MSIQAGASPSRNPTAGAACCSACRAWKPGRVLVLGGGTVGNNAATMAVGIGADGPSTNPGGAAPPGRDLRRPGKTLYATRDAIERLLMQADLVIGAVLIPGATAQAGHRTMLAP